MRAGCHQHAGGSFAVSVTLLQECKAVRWHSGAPGVLSSQRQHLWLYYVRHDQTCKRREIRCYSPRVFGSDSVTYILSCLSIELPHVDGLSLHTKIYSQFSDVKFSSVALAVHSVSRCLELLGDGLRHTDSVVESILLRSKHFCY